MRLLVLSAAPLFPDRVIGGSQRILTDILPALSKHVEHVKVLCPGIEENQHGFDIGRAQVLPSLRLAPFPTPWRIAPSNLRTTINTIRDAAEHADKIYIHGDALYPRSALCNKPIVRSFHDFLYQEALLSAFSERAALTITPSDYIKNCISLTASPDEPIITIPNGVPFPTSVPKSVTIKGISPRLPDEIVLLLPHRPDPSKGLTEALSIAVEVTKAARRPVRLAAARFKERLNRDGLNTKYEEMLCIAEKIAPEVTLEIYPWLPYDEMPYLYAFADAVLCPGTFVESFGLAPLESVAAGTPAVVAKVGALRAFESIPNLRTFSYGNHSEAAVLVLEVLNNPKTEQGREFVKENFSLQKMTRGYVEAITGTLPQTFNEHSPSSQGKKLLAAPWVFAEGTRIWDDYASSWREDLPHLAKFIENLQQAPIESVVPPEEIRIAKRDSVVLLQ